jgi:dephospho-CoA kinase
VHLFGLTGGIASGKSTVAARFRFRGLPVIDADQLAREVVAPGSEGLRALVETFGTQVLTPDGTLDRPALASIVFSDDLARAKLEVITHPLITRLATERAAALALSGEPLVCYEAALIVENGAADHFRPLVLAACPEELQIARVLARPGATLEDVHARIRAQKSLADKMALADLVVDTGGAREEGERGADEALAGVCRILGMDAGRYGLQPE